MVSKYGTMQCPRKVMYSFLILGSTVVVLIFHLLTPLNSIHTVNELTLDTYNQLDNKDEFFKHVDDMWRLQKSIKIELGHLEEERNQLKNIVKDMESKRKETEVKLQEMLSTINQTRVNIAQLLLQKKEILKEYPPIALPHKLRSENGNHYIAPPPKSSPCQLHNCFDYSRCSILSQFPVYIYNSIQHSSLDMISQHWLKAVKASPYATEDGDTACLFIVFIRKDYQMQDLQRLKYWHGDGHNHLLVNVDLGSPYGQFLSSSPNEGHRAMKVQTGYDIASYQPGFDIVVPTVDNVQTSWEDKPLMLPARRKYFITFYGKAPKQSDLSFSEQSFLKSLSSLHLPRQQIRIVLDCEVDGSCSNKYGWCVCEDHTNIDLLPQSTFTLVVAPSDHNITASPQVSSRLRQAFQMGAIPVLLGTTTLPLDTIIPWSKACIMLPKPRITELMYILRNILDEDIVQYRKQGRFIFDTFLADVNKTAHTLLAYIRMKLNIPPKSAPELQSQIIYNENNFKLTYFPKSEVVEEVLGPVEDPFPSRTFTRNFTSWKVDDNDLVAPFYLYPNTPWDPVLPTDAKFHGSPYGFRPVNNGTGGSGREFSQALGGNLPREQFTIVILTYDRQELLQQQLLQFKGLPYLNKVLVIWNNPILPSAFVWPDIGVPLQVLKAERNSLNNRFLPYKEIETEAILSLDDDMSLRHDEIIFAFRVWREARDRIVGFPGRYHAWDTSGEVWHYNSNHSCELSMVLTGAAFFHKYYTYQYTYFMPEAIKAKVDELMNCEDIAMNFLVSHLTGKPPIKVTSRWTFRCPSCGEASLWIDESHFLERHSCINFFIKVYGYLPLMYTQFRADSVLFKTRVPPDKKKCFTYV